MKRIGALLLLLAPALALRAQEPARHEPPAGRREALRAAAFAPERTRERRERLLAALPEGALVLVVQRPQPKEDYDEWRPSPDLLYLTGARDPELVLLVSRQRHVLFAPPRDTKAERWRGPRLAPGEAAARELGLDAVLPLASLKEHAGRTLSEAQVLHVAGLSNEKARALAHLPEGCKVERAERPIGLLRQVKDEAELALMAHAVDVTCAGHREAIGSVAPGLFEYEVQAVAEYVFRRHGAERQGYASIVGSGPNSCILHYNASRRRIAEGDVICADMGAEVAGYTADVTRTFPASGRFTEEQRRVYEVVLEAQEAAIREVKPGSTLQRVHAAAQRVIAEAGYGKYFPHYTSHWLGLDVHDVGDPRRPFEPGMVLTVEPGIYIPEKEIGVRIEDDVVVTRDGHLNLSRDLPKTAEAIEKLVRERRGVGWRALAPIPERGPESVPPGPPRRRLF